jgi:Mrp family chromosome partitioning ATPase
LTAAAEPGEPVVGGWRVVLVLALVGALIGFGWGIADQPRWWATATVAVESDSQGSDEARLERFAQRGESDEVATTAAGLIGDDVPGADLLSDVTVRPSPRGGSLTITATADAPDVAAAAADGFQRALVEVEGDPLALGKAASIPAEPYEDRSAALWAGIGFLAGLVAGLIAAVLLAATRRRRSGIAPARPAERPEPAPADPLAAFADALGARLTGYDAGPEGSVTRDVDGVGIPARAVAEVGMLADRLRLRSAGGPGSLAVTAVGDEADVADIAAALAVAAAGAGRRVLLVEADLGAPGLAAAFGVASAPGLADYLDGGASPQEVLRTVPVVPGGSAGFAFVPAGNGVEDASVAVPRFEGLVGRLARVYDLVVYAAPPVLGSSDADAVAVLTDAVAVLVGPDAGPDDLDDAAGLLGGARVAVVAAASR